MSRREVAVECGACGHALFIDLDGPEVHVVGCPTCRVICEFDEAGDAIRVTTETRRRPTAAHERTRPSPTGNYLETETLRVADALDLVAAGFKAAGNSYAAMRLLNLARQAEEVVGAETARRRAAREAAEVGSKEKP